MHAKRTKLGPPGTAISRILAIMHLADLAVHVTSQFGDQELTVQYQLELRAFIIV